MNDHKRLSIRFLKTYQPDALAIVVPNGQKAPTVKTDFSGPDALVKSESAIKSLEQEANSFQPGVVLKGRWVDVDLDEVNLVLEAALSQFLRTSFVYGRKSKPRSHFLVMLAEEFEEHDTRFEFMKSVKAMGLNMEIRGHSRNYHNHTNMPGGQHESGESVTWYRPNDVENALTATPPMMQSDEFARALRKAIIAAKMVDFWGEGSRHELALGLAGALAKNYKMIMESEDSSVSFATLLDEKDCESILRFICEHANDEEVEDRIAASRSTWKKNDFTKIAGYDKLRILIGEENARLLRVTMAGSTFMDQLEKFNQMVAYSPVESAFILLDEIKDYGIVMRKPMEYSAHEPSHQIMLPGKTPKMVHASRLLRTFQITRNISRYDSVPDHPILIDNKDGTYTLNSFPGWRVPEWKEPLKETDPDIAWMLEHVFTVIASGDKAAMHWVLSWWADIYQDPTRKPGTAIVLVGQQGAGKSSLSSVLGGALGIASGTRRSVHRKLYMKTDNMERVMGRFNDHTEGALFVQLEEVIHNPSSRTRESLTMASRLKDLITKETDLIEPKGGKIREIPSYQRYLFTSNSLTQASKIESRDRRYTVLEVSPLRANDLDYWHDAMARIERELFHSKVFTYLKNYKYDKKLIQRPYETEAKRVMRDFNLIRDEQEADLNFLEFLISNPNMPFEHRLIEAHWEATTEQALEAYNKAFAQGLWLESWPQYVSPALWERQFQEFVVRKMRMAFGFSTNQIFFLNKMTTMLKVQRTVKWTTRDATQQRVERRERLMRFPDRATLFKILNEKRPLDQEKAEEIEELIAMDRLYRYKGNVKETKEEEF